MAVINNNTTTTTVGHDDGFSRPIMSRRDIYRAVRDARVARETATKAALRAATTLVADRMAAARRAVGQLTACPCAECLERHQITNAEWCTAQTEYNVLKKKFAGMKPGKETKAEYRLRWLARQEAEQRFAASKQRRAEKRAERLRLRNRFWAMHRLGMVSYEENWDVPHPDPRVTKSARRVARRAAEKLADTASKRAAREAVNHHEGKPSPPAPREKLRWRDLVAVARFDWDRWSHVVSWPSDRCPVLESYGRLFGLVKTALENVRASAAGIGPIRSNAGPSPWLPQMDCDDSVAELVYQTRMARLRPQMDSSVVPPAISKSEATVAIDAVAPSVSEPLPTPESDHSRLCGECIPDDKTMSSREFCFQTKDWLSSQKFGTEICSVALPADIITTYSDQPNFVMFSNHRYWRGDMEITIRLNSNARQYGQLLATVWYQECEDANFDLRNNIATAVQNNHALVTANQSNSATLVVPFRYAKQYLDLTWKEKKSGAHHCTLKVFVMVPLTTVDSGPQRCNFSLYVRFTDSCFVGVVHRSVVRPQMFTALMALQLMDKMRGDANRDMPVVPANPSHMKPVTTHNWAAGTAQSRVSAPLRLNPNAVLAYSGDSYDEMQASFVASIFGFLRSTVWNVGHLSKSLLFKTEANPLLQEMEYYAHSAKINGVDHRGFVLPPVAVLSSMFAYWRGELEYRFDVVGPTEISGRLMIAFVPGVGDPTYDQCMGSNPVYVDVQENRSFTYTVPYVSDRPWRNRARRDGNADGYIPIMGRLCIYVVNSLIINTSIPDKCIIVSYVRGSPSFEVAVPVQPLIGLSWNSEYLTGVQAFGFDYRQGYAPTYVGGWREFGNGAYAIMRYGETTDHITQLDERTCQFLNKIKDHESSHWGYFRILVGETDDVTGLTFDTSQDGKPVKQVVLYYVPWQGGQNDYWYIVPTTARQYAEKLAMGFKRGRTPDEMAGTLWKYTKSSEFLTVNGASPRMEWVWMDITGQIDERFVAPTLVATQRLTPMTGYGQTTFGESFHDLKDLIRRTSLYMEQSPSITSPANTYAIRVPVLPQGLPLAIGREDLPNLHSNAMRDDVRSIIASAYRYFSGSMGLKVVSSGRRGFFVQHQPLPMQTDKPVMITTSTGKKAIVGAADIMENGLAMYVQAEENSNIAEVEVPYYMPGEMGLLQRYDFAHMKDINPDMLNYSSLGQLCIGRLPGGDFVDATYTIYANGGDDLRFFGFQGFPPVNYIIAQMPHVHPVGPPPNKPVKDVRRIVRMSGQRRTSVLSQVSSADGSDFEQLEPQMHVPILSDLIDAAASFKSAGSRVDNFTAQIASVDISNVVEETLTDVKETASYTGYFSFLYNAVTNIVHCILNPSWKAVCWAFASMFQYLFSLKDNIVSKITALFSKLMNRCWKGRKNQDEEIPLLSTSEMRPQMNVENDFEPTGEPRSFFRKYAGELASVLVAGIMTYLGYQSWSGEVDCKFTDLIHRMVRTFTTTVNGLLSFFKSTIAMLTEMFDWCLARLFPSWSAVNFLAKHDNDIFKWAQDVQTLTDQRNRAIVLTDPIKISKLYSAANEACLIQQKILTMDAKFTGSQLSVLTRLIRDITKLRDYAAGLHIAPPVKFEPFVIQIAGPPKVGKSYIMDDLTIDLLYDVGYRTYGEPTYTRSPGNDYWNNLLNQPIVKYDDFLAVTESSVAMPQISELFQLKTRCVFNPPMASVEDKTIRYNPIIVGLCSNAAYYNLSGILDPSALHRRRDVLVTMRLKPEYKSIDDIHDPEILKNWDHVVFDIHKDPINAEAGELKDYSYAQFKTHVQTIFNDYYHKETARYKDISSRIYRLAPKNGEEEFKFANHEVGENLANYFERKANPVSREDVIMKTALARSRGYTGYRVKRLKNEFGKLINNADPNLKPEDRHGHVMQTLVTAMALVEGIPYCDLLNQLERNILDFKTPSQDESTRLALVNSFFPQGPSIAVGQIEPVAGPSSGPGGTPYDSDEEAEMEDEVVRTVNPSEETVQADLKCAMALYKRRAIPSGCVHNYANYEFIANPLLEYDYENNFWFVPRSQVSLSNAELRSLERRWAECYLEEWTFLRNAEMEEVLTFPHGACKNCDKCPFLDKNKRTYFIHRYVTMNPQYLNWHLHSDERLKECVPEEFMVGPTELGVTEESWSSWISGMKNKLMKAPWAFILKALGYVTLILSTVVAVYRYFGAQPADPEEEDNGLQGQGMAPAKYDAMMSARNARKKVRMGRQFHRNIKRMATGGRMDAQMNLNPTLKDHVDITFSSLVRKNTVFITVSKEGEGKPTTARCLGIVDRVIIFPNHYYDVWQALIENHGFTMTMSDPLSPQSIPIDFSEMEVWVSESSSLAYARLPPKCRMFRDIRQHFLKKEEEFPDKVAGTLFELQCNPHTHNFDLVKTIVQGSQQGRSHVGSTKLFDAFVVSAGYTYPYGGSGVCGSIFVSNQGKILSMHVAGTENGVGLGEQLTYADIDFCSSQMKFRGDIQLDELDIIDVHSVEGYQCKVDTAIAVLGMVDKEVGNYALPESGLHPSAATALLTAAGFTSTTEPAVLSKKDPRIAEAPFDPLVEGVKNHGVCMKAFPRSTVDQIVEDYRDLILSKCPPVIEPRVLTIEESIMGVSGIQYCDSVDITTSAGWPWRADGRQFAAQKQSWIALNYENDQPKFMGLDPTLKEVMEEKQKQRLEGLVPFTVFADVLKDETLPSEKAIRLGGTRVVSMSPIDFTIQQRQYTVPFVAAFMHHRLDLEHAVGIDPNSEEWTRLFAKIVGEGRTHFIAADYSKFGDRLPVELGKACFEIIADWYSQHGCPNADGLRQTLSVMSEEVFSAKHIFGRTIYQTYTGQPSGNTMTVIFNSMVNSMFMRAAWVEIMGETPYAGLDNFKELVTLYTYGDDIIASVDDCAAKNFNTITISEFFKKYDLKFTDADKEGIMRPFRTVDEMVFLKRTWKPFPQDGPVGLRRLLLAPLDVNTIEQVPFWVQKGLRTPEGAVHMLRESLRLAFSHGPEYYRNLVQRYSKISRTLGIQLMAPHWNTLAYRTYIKNTPLMIGYIKYLNPHEPEAFDKVTE